jgi:hypothetical protein
MAARIRVFSSVTGDCAPSAAELRAGKLNDSHLMFQKELHQLSESGRIYSGSVGDGVLVQQAVG